LASRFGCPAVEAAPLPTLPVAPEVQPTTSPQPEATRARPSENDPLVRAPSNLSGICDRTVQSKIDGALTGSLNVEEVIDDVEARLWAMTAVLPIMQDTTIVAAGPSVRNVSLTGAVPVGIVGDAGRWIKVGR